MYSRVAPHEHDGPKFPPPEDGVGGKLWEESRLGWKAINSNRSGYNTSLVSPVSVPVVLIRWHLGDLVILKSKYGAKTLAQKAFPLCGRHHYSPFVPVAIHVAQFQDLDDEEKAERGLCNRGGLICRRLRVLISMVVISTFLPMMAGARLVRMLVLEWSINEFSKGNFEGQLWKAYICTRATHTYWSAIRNILPVVEMCGESRHDDVITVGEAQDPQRLAMAFA